MELTVRFQQALQFATERHHGQVRKGTGIPYIAHLLAVASIAIEHGANEDEAIAALLHDAVEDQKATLAEIRVRFGDVVADIVEGCSDTDVAPRPPWRPRKEAYIAYVAAAPRSVRLVAAADKLHNARTALFDYRIMAEALWNRFNGGRETLWYYRGLVKAFRAAGSTPLIDELDRVVSELERLAGPR
jgi:(p)ppGpp synthase/HD superfamily hydrolase